MMSQEREDEAVAERMMEALAARRRWQAMRSYEATRAKRHTFFPATDGEKSLYVLRLFSWRSRGIPDSGLRQHSVYFSELSVEAVKRGWDILMSARRAEWAA